MEDLIPWFVLLTAVGFFWLGMRFAHLKFDAMRSEDGILLVMVTEEDGQVYFHDYIDSEFFLQAKTMKEGVDALIKRFPDTTIVIVGHSEPLIVSGQDESV